jgi:hypothetical protein
MQRTRCRVHIEHNAGERFHEDRIGRMFKERTEAFLAVAQRLFGTSPVDRDAGQVRSRVEQLQFIHAGRFRPHKEDREDTQDFVTESSNWLRPTGPQL